MRFPKGLLLCLIAMQLSAANVVRRLPPSSFTALPPGVVNALNVRGCKVPQPTATSKKNVLHGRFFDSKSRGWAIVCSARGDSFIVVFPDDTGSRSETVARIPDNIYATPDPEGRVNYQREIQSVGRAYVLSHYNSYGGPKPPPISHDCIDDGYFEKASVVHYRHRGKWMQLQGAD